MKILHFFKTYWPDTFGGIERTIHAIATGTTKFGMETDVLSLSRTPTENAVRFDGHSAHKAKLDLDIASTGLSREVFRKFSELSRNADLVHYHFPWPMMDFVHFASAHRKPSIVTYHSDIVKQKLLSRLYSPLMHRFLTSVDRIVATSPNYLESSDVLKSYKSKTAIIPLGLNELDYPSPSEAVKTHWKNTLPERFFLFVGVLRYYKGAHILLDAAKRSGLHVVIVGDGPLRAELQQKAGQENIQNVKFLGAVSDADKVALLDLSIGLVFPSHLRSEAFGLSLVEAAMQGKPMISCEIGTGTSYVNVNGETGLVVAPNDSEALARAMHAMADNAALTDRFGIAARHRYETCLTADRMAAAYADLYRIVVR